MVSECLQLRLLAVQIVCLNPCFSGGWSRREWYNGDMPFINEVLILVLVEDGLGAVQEK